MTGKTSNAGRMALKGKLEQEGELTDVVQMIVASRWTGALHVLTPRARRTVFFKDGDVRAAASDAPEERLGEILCREGAITRDQLDAALARPQDQKRLGSVLVQQKLITTHDLYYFIRKQMEEVFFALLTICEGEFYFHRRDLPDALPAQLHLTTHDLLLEGMERMAELARFRQEIPSFAIVFEQAEEPDDVDALPAPERAIYTNVDGRRSLQEIAEEAALPEFHATQAAFALLESGLIRPAGAHRRTTKVSDTRTALLEQLVGAFNEVFRRFHAAAESRGQAEDLREAAVSFFEEGTVHPALFRGIELGPEGTLDAATLVENLSRTEVEDPSGYLYAGLDEFLFFQTFVVGETVDDAVERGLKARLEEARGALAWRAEA